MEIIEEIKRISALRLTDASQFVVEVVVSGFKGPKKILVVIDGEKTVTIDDCANLSRELSKALDDSQFSEDNYLLEVSTPGLDQPLKLKRQYYKNIGRNVKVVLSQATAEGKLIEVTDDKIKLEQKIGQGKHQEIETVEISISQIDKIFVLVSFK